MVDPLRAEAAAGSVVSVRAASNIGASIAALVHPASSASGLERTRHAIFIGLHLAASLASLATVPVWLALHGAPSLAAAFGVLLSQAPLVAALVLARGSSFRLAQLIAAFGFIALGCLIAISAPSFEAVAYGLFVVAMFEIASALDARFGAATAIGVLTAVVVILLARSAWEAPASVEADHLIVGLACLPVLAYAGALAWATARVAALRLIGHRREVARHRALATAIGDLVLQVDRSGAALSCSPEAGPLFALTPRDFSGRGLYERVHIADRPAFLQAVSEAFLGLQTQTAVLRLRTGSVRSTRGDFDEPVHVWIEMRVRQLAEDDPSGGGDRAVCVVRDVSRLKLYEEKIGEAKQAAERANASRDRFLANVSHELRTPLNAIIGFADMMASPTILQDDTKRREYAGIISASGQHLLSVVNSILDMSKLEAGSFDVVPARFDPSPLLEQCIDLVRLKAAESKVRLVRAYPADLAAVIADERACKQIVINLLSNAVKFTPAGGSVTLTATCGDNFVLTVDDTGIGISMDDMPRLGDAFFQASNSHARSFEGTGLGLSLVRGLVGLHGGAIQIESAPNRGTRVVIRLPMDCRGVVPAGDPAVIHVMPRPSSILAPALEKVKSIA
jgi:cell cycle sensor histidine kinase DivJ